MLPIISFIVLLGCVFGGFMLSGGKMDIILHALPYEGLIIGGSAIGAFLIGNSMGVVKMSMSGIMKVVKGPKWKSDDYRDLLVMMFEFTRLYSKDPNKVDAHIESPSESNIFSKYPKIQGDHHVMEIISDTYRSILLGFNDGYQVEDHLNLKLKKHHHEMKQPVKALQTMADGLPALGIVAAVLGVIKTMASVDQPPAILGAMIGGALVGTFLGVFLAYCLVSPIAARLSQVEEDDSTFYKVISNIIISSVNGDNPVISAELGRSSVPSNMQPDFYEIEEKQKAVK
jgi:chemotaxis protein MotA